MDSFKCFLERADPISIADRVARIKGHKNYNRNGLRAEAGKHIPLTNKGHPSSVGSAVSKYEKLGTPKPTEKITLDVKDLLATQPYVEVGDKNRLKSKVEGGINNAHVITHKGKHYVADGHHEILAARLRGEKRVTVHHTNLDAL